MWRKTPPTVEEVKTGTRYEYGCQYWWNRTPNEQPRILALDYDAEENKLVICDFQRGFPGTDGFNPDDWGDEWALCIPPTTTEEQVHTLLPPNHSCGPGCFYHFGG